MTYKKFIVVPFLLLTVNESAQASSYPPSLNNLFTGKANAPSSADFAFDSRGLTVSVSGSGSSYTLTAHGTGNLTYYSPGNTTTYAGTSTSYTLTANFTQADHIISLNHGELTISSTLGLRPTAIGGVALNAPVHNLLYDAQLTGFKVGTEQGDLGFTTAFNPSWSNQTPFTGGSQNESVYLFDQLALANGGIGRLTQLVDAFASGDLSAISNITYSNVESFAVIPLPSPVVLFGSGLTALIGLRHQRRNNSK
ncbi:hypothetical protein KEF85_12545 [Methylomonas paludis]|uniref:PEP-CTERM sorting domain-containing protein n=1 Tax=Methylomonas paludis TaxID=1173101 RepID=A0A975MLM6_9GAMM|nr:hypothetical protein [Methylomonas paludis]QWF70168.1 hypothetical protein KEF85_12545 [Methylomonas paludis]